MLELETGQHEQIAVQKTGRQPLPLYIQLTLLIVVVLAGTMALFVYQTVSQEAETLSYIYRTQTQALAKKIAVFSRDSFTGGDFSELDSMMKNTQIPWNLDMTIMDAGGKILKKVIIGRRDFVAPNYENKFFQPPKEFTPVFEQRYGWFHIWEPVLGETVPLGWIRLSYSLKITKNIEKRVWKSALENGLPIIIGSVSLLLIFLWRPIRAIRGATDFALRLDELRGETISIDRSFLEVYQLGNALNQASLRLTSQDKSLSQSKERLQAVVSELESQKYALDQHAIVSVVDINGNIHYVNDKFCEVSGFSRDELVGQSQLIQYPQDYPTEFFEQLWQTIAQGKLWHGEIKQRKNDGGSFWADTTIVPFLDKRGVPYKYYMIRTDVSDRKDVEEQLTEKNKVLELLRDGLEEEVNQRTKDLKKANAELEKLNQVKSEFISIVSHELRTPLTSIKSFAEILYDDAGDMALETQQKYLSIIDKESDRLGRLISDVLDLQKIDAGKNVWKDIAVDLNNIVGDCAETFAAKCKERQLNLNLNLLDSDAWVLADPDKLTQVVTNLLSNAIKFTDQGDIEIKMCMALNEIQTAYFKLSVHDSGIGISEQEQEKIFERFHQVDGSQTRERGGSGLGLSICKEIVEHYGGTISVQSVLGEGSTFIVCLDACEQKKKLGEILIENGMLTEKQLDEALKQQQ